MKKWLNDKLKTIGLDERSIYSFISYFFILHYLDCFVIPVVVATAF